MKKTILSLMVGALVFSLMSVGFAKQHRTQNTTAVAYSDQSSKKCMGKKCKYKAHFKKMMKKLSLTVAQKKQVKQLMQQYRPQFMSIKKQ